MEHVANQLRHAGSALAVLTLAGCAGASVTGISEAAVQGPPPHAILVEVDTYSLASADEGGTARRVGTALGRDLVRQLDADHLAALERPPGTLPAGSVVLHVDVTRADEGDRLQRLVIGFGAGKARLTATASLEAAGGRPLTTFDTASDSGMKPGLIVPGGIAAATGNLVHLAIGGGIDLALNARDGLAAPTKRTAGAIVKQLRTYYAAAGWPWPKTS